MDPNDITAESQEEYRRYLADTFGPDVLVGLATDQDPARTPNASARQMDSRRRQDRQDAQHDQDLAQLQVDARERREDEALERARTMIDAGRTPDRATVMLAARAQERHGSGLSSAELMAGPTLARLQREQAQDQRDGRRPSTRS